jgi:Protein of unknown function (DUF3151)
MERENLLGAGPAATYLLDDAEAAAALSEAGAANGADGAGLKAVAGRFPEYSAAWAALAEWAERNGDPVTAYAYARTGYHRGLDQLRRAGWRGNGPVPWSHEPNRGFLRSLNMLAVAAAAIGEEHEADRCSQFLRDSSAEAAAELAVQRLAAGLRFGLAGWAGRSGLAAGLRFGLAGWAGRSWLAGWAGRLGRWVLISCGAVALLGAGAVNGWRQ